MNYYFVAYNDVYQECLALFETFQDSVKKEILKKAENDSDGDYDVEMVLSRVFIGLVDKKIDKCNNEGEIPQVMKNLLEKFFDAEDADEEPLELDESDHDDNDGW